jgi:superfamily II DNA or RNA helicase
MLKMGGEYAKYISDFGRLETSERSNLRFFLQRDLEKEYQPRHKNKSKKMLPNSIEALELNGEDIRINVRDGGDLHKVHITFPLFDVEKDITKVQCSCLNQLRHYETMRCHHLFYVQDSLIKILDDLEKTTDDTSAASSTPLDDLLSLCLGTTLPDGEAELFDAKWQIHLNRQRWELQFEKWVQPRYGREKSWERKERLSFEEWLRESHLGSLGEALKHSAGDSHDETVLSILEKIASFPAEAQPLWIDGQPSQCHIKTPRIKILEEAEGFHLQIVLGDQELAVQRLVPQCGLVAWDPDDSGRSSQQNKKMIYLASLRGREGPLMERLLSIKEPISYHERSRLLLLLSHAGSYLEGESGPSKLIAQDHKAPVPLLRLTPFKQGGMKIQILMQWSSTVPVVPGEGPSFIRDFADLKGEAISRDFNRECQLASRLMGLLDLDELPEPEPWTVIAYNDDLCLQFISRLEEAKSNLPFEVEWPQYLAKEHRPYRLAPHIDQGSLNVTVSEKRDWFDMQGWLETEEGTKISLRELLASIRRQQKYLRLPDGRWALISEHFARRMAPLVACTEEDSEFGLTINLAALAEADIHQSLLKFPFAEVSRAFWSQLQRISPQYSSQDLGYPLPPGLKASLRPYQMEGFQWLQKRYEWRLGACLADDMGLGKTVQTLAILLNNCSVGPSLVIAPSSLAFNWAAEAQKFCPDLKITLLRDLPGRGVGHIFEAGEVLLASYGLVIRHWEHLAQVPWNIMILDEAQNLKNGTTKTAQAVQMIKAQWILALSGTPLENRLSDLWSLFRTVSPGLFGEWERFCRAFVFPIERDKNPAAIARLKTKIEPFILRRMKKDHLHELPVKTEVDLWVDLNDDERHFYEALRDEAILKIQKFDPHDEALQPKRQIAILAAMTSLRQASCHRQILDPQWANGSTKIDLLRERLFELKATSQSALVFSQFTRFLRLIHQDLADHGFKLLYIDGATALDERRKVVEQFQTGQFDALLVSLKAGGTGLNLTQASYVFHMDPWWNPAVENQATDRAHRMGQKQAVTVYKLRSRQTIEEMIHKLHGDKTSLVDSLFH